MPIDDKSAKDMPRIGAILSAIINPKHKPLTPIQGRLLSMPLPDEEALRGGVKADVRCRVYADSRGSKLRFEP